MPSTPPPLWDGYDDADEDQLAALLDRKVDAAIDPDNPAVDEVVTRDFARAIASHEWLKRKLGADDYHPRLHAEADRIRSADIGSWRPK
jgi:hypothetical protein